MVTNFHLERPSRENGTTFSEFPFVPGIFQWDESKIVYHLHPNRNFREFVVNGKQPINVCQAACTSHGSHSPQKIDLILRGGREPPKTGCPDCWRISG